MHMNIVLSVCIFVISYIIYMFAGAAVVYVIGEYYEDGGDYIELLKWLEEERLPDLGYTFHIHSMNPVGVANMRTIIEHNGWKEIK